jgi:hypothetical protein
LTAGDKPALASDEKSVRTYYHRMQQADVGDPPRQPVDVAEIAPVPLADDDRVDTHAGDGGVEHDRLHQCFVCAGSPAAAGALPAVA